jgi:hypothetical protein
MTPPPHLLGIQSDADIRPLLERIREARVELRRLEKEGMFPGLLEAKSPDELCELAEALRHDARRLLDLYGLSFYFDTLGETMSTVIAYPARSMWIAYRSHKIAPGAWSDETKRLDNAAATAHLLTILGHKTHPNYEYELHSRIDSTLRRHERDGVDD